MAIAKIPSTQPPKPIPNPPLIKSNIMQNEVVNAGYTPLKNLMVYASGKAWMSTFLNQKLGEGSEPMAPQLDASKSTQSYHRIRKFILKVQSELQRNPNPQDGETEVTGSAHIMPGIIPNFGDAFFADIGDGNVGVFVISNVEQMSIYNDTAYYIEYGLLDYLTKEIEAQFNDRVVQESIYDMDYVNTGKNPIIAYDEYFTRERMYSEEISLIDHFFNNFFDRDVGTLAVPGQDGFRKLYDPFHVRYVDRLIELDKLPSRMRMLTLDETLGAIPAPVTIWDMLVKQDIRQFNYVVKNMQALPSRYFRGGSVLMGGVAYSGFEDIVYPVSSAVPNMANDLLGSAETNRDEAGILFRDLHIRDNYVFSAAFYNQRRVDMNMLERETHNLITAQPISVANVDLLLNAYYTAPPVVQYYAFPLLVTLCRAASQRLV